jgi:hypothetical protein
MNPSSPLKRGVLFGIPCAVFGAFAWALIALLTERSAELPVATGIGAIFWGGVGFLIGALDPSKRAGSRPQILPSGIRKRRTALWIVGQIIYRSVVGCVVGNLAGSVVVLIGVGLEMSIYGEFPKPQVAADRMYLIGATAFLAGTGGSMVGGLVGAWLCPKDGFPTSLWGSIWGGLLGLVCGALTASILITDIAKLATYFGPILIEGSFAGVLGGILARGRILSRKFPTPPSVAPEMLQEAKKEQ